MSKPVDKEYLTNQFINFNKSIYKEGDIITILPSDNLKLPELRPGLKWVKLRDKKLYH